MSVDEFRQHAGADIDGPVFRLNYLTDDEANPEASTEITIFDPDDDSIATHWITIDADSAEPMEAWR